MSTETRRDLAADLAICEAATAGPWEASVETILDADDPDAKFIVEARTGWPHAIERALAAEKRLLATEIIADILRCDIERLRRQLPITNEQAAEQLRFEREGRR